MTITDSSCDMAGIISLVNIRLILNHSQQQQMSNSQFNIYASGALCMACIGTTEGSCFCNALADGTPISIRNISSEVEYLDDPTEDSSNNSGDSNSQTPLQNPPAPTPKNSKRSSIKDNIAYKRISKIMQDCYRSLTGTKVPLEIKRHYYKENYFLMLITLLEKEGKLWDVEGLFQERMTLFAQRIEQEYADQPEYLQHLQVLIVRHQEALSCYMNLNRPVEESMKILYDYDHMRQKQHFIKALKEIVELRKEHGLPI